jgi:hypothetical protein
MKEIKTRKINILPDRSLMPKLGQAGYSVSQAIAELVDNSIDARLEDRPLIVEIILDQDKDLVQITDNGVGMSEEIAANSIRLASSSKKNQLGEFGLGLKTAATSLGKFFQIITTQAGSNEEYILEYDEDKWLSSGSWNEHEMKIKKGVDEERSGTIIKIKKLSFNIYPNLPGRIREDLAIRFAPYIENGEIRIKVNTKWCEPKQLDLKMEYCLPDGKEQFKFPLESGNEVWGWRGLLKKGSERGEYGFRVFRRGRLIMQYAKLGFSPHPEARQIVGEIHLDHVPVTHNKREFIQESPLYREIIEENGTFWNYMREIVREARSSIRKSQFSQAINDKIDIQKDNIMKAVKNLPQLKEYSFPDIKDKVSASKEKNDGLAELEIEKRDPRDSVTIVEQHQEQGVQGRKPHKTHIKKTYYLIVNGKKFKVEHAFVDLKNEDILKDKNIDETNGIQVFTNISFPAFASTPDHVFYATWNIAEAIAEAMVELNKRPSGEVIRVRDLILKKSSEIGLELDEVEKEKKNAEKLKKDYEESIKKIREIEEKHANNN